VSQCSAVEAQNVCSFYKQWMLILTTVLAGCVDQFSAKFCHQCRIFPGNQKVWKGDHSICFYFNNAVDSQC